MHPLELKIPPVAVAFIAMGLIWLSDRLLPGLSAQSSLRGPLSLLLLLAGAGLGVAGVLQFRRAQTTVDPFHLDRASAMVASGVYARTRNPMYLGLALIVAAFAAWYGNLVGGLIVPLFVLYMNRFQIVPEERMLSIKFGAPYRNYCGKVRRWI